MQRYAKFGPQVIGAAAQELYDAACSDEAIDRAVRVVGEYHPQTAVHMIEVSRMLAAFMVNGVVDYSHEDQVRLTQTGALHDIGKLTAIPLRVLDNSSRLNDGDWKMVRQHPEAGFRLAHIHDCGDLALPILLHHELQPNNYTSERDRNKILSEYGVNGAELGASDKKIWIDTLLLAVADHYSARYPYSVARWPYISKDQSYGVEHMDTLIKADFMKAGRVRELGLVSFLDSAVAVAQELALSSRPLPVALPRSTKTISSDIPKPPAKQ